MRQNESQTERKHHGRSRCLRYSHINDNIIISSISSRRTSNEAFHHSIIPPILESPALLIMPRLHYSTPYSVCIIISARPCLIVLAPGA